MNCINDILIECVKACGGSKSVGAQLWPELAADKAQRKLLDCLNPDRDHKLSPEQAVFILGLSRTHGNHLGMQALCAMLGYSQPHPISTEDKAAELKTQFNESVRQLALLAKQIEGLQ
jgi:hypothetical protein